MLCFSPPMSSLFCPPPSPTPPHPPFRKPQHEQRKEQEPKRPHIKKPLNAFMLYMKEMRANVVAECTLKESAAINQILGRRVSTGMVHKCSWEVRNCFINTGPKWTSASGGHRMHLGNHQPLWEVTKRTRYVDNLLED